MMQRGIPLLETWTFWRGAGYLLGLQRWLPQVAPVSRRMEMMVVWLVTALDPELGPPQVCYLPVSPSNLNNALGYWSGVKPKIRWTTNKGMGIFIQAVRDSAITWYCLLIICFFSFKLQHVTLCYIRHHYILGLLSMDQSRNQTVMKEHHVFLDEKNKCED